MWNYTISRDKLTLALAKRAAGGRSLLILDEPFTSFDSDRLSNALAMLKKFHNESDWQVIILTKDDFLADQIKEIFPNEKVKEHRLAVLEKFRRI